MAESTFNNPQHWLDDLTGTFLENQAENETDKRKWSTLNDLPEHFIKHFNSGDKNDPLTQLEEQNIEASTLDSSSPNEIRQKRKEQNRVAQRAFRERKQQLVKELEDKVAELEQSRINETKHLQEENHALRLKVKRMQTEIYTLKGAENAFKLTIQKLREAGIQLPTDTTTATSPLATPPTSESSFCTTSNQQQYTSPTSSTSTALSPLTAIDLSVDLDHHLDDSQSSISSPPQKMQQQQQQQQQQHHHYPERQHSPSNNNMDLSTNHSFVTTEDNDTIGFATSETDRFNHQPDPLVEQGAKMIPYSQIWEKVQEHPKYDLFDIDQLCEDLKKKAKCSGFGAVILEEDFYSVLEKYDV